MDWETFMGLADLKRVTDLFVEGEEVVIRDGDDAVLLWVNKLNSFEMEEARRDGAAARSRVVLALKDIGSPEQEQFEGSLQEQPPAQLKQAIVNAQGNEHLMAAVENIRNDPEWKDRVEASSRRSDDMGEDEKAAVAKIDEEYTAELSKRMAARREDALRDLDPLDMDGLREKYRELWQESRGMAAFSREFQKSQMYFAVRVCRAKAKVPGTSAWDHSACDGHRQRALDNREEVTQLPGALFELLLTAVRNSTVDRRDARFSDALASSSESSAQPSEEGASTPSTPTETQRELATTSS